MTKKYRLQSMQAAQCHVVIDINDAGKVDHITLVSYNTTVIEIDMTDSLARLVCHGTYSVTTARHINRFTTDFVGVNLYHECKEMVGKGKKVCPYITLSEQQTYNCYSECSRYYNDRFIKPVRKYFGKY